MKLVNFIQMKVLTIKSIAVLDEALQRDVHYTFGMEHYTDYVFTPREDREYSGTIVLDKSAGVDSSGVIRNVVSASASFPEHEFQIDDLDMERNSIDRYRVKNGEILQKQQTGWEWD